MSPAKLQFSVKELELVTNSDWILTKNNIIQKIIAGFGLLHEQYRAIIDLKKDRVPPGILSSGFKISRGENYLGLPWVIMDCPRLFGKDDILAIRTMFWWGNFFSITLHLSGKWKLQFEPRVISALSKLEQAGYSISVSDDQWLHHFNPGNYIPLKNREKAVELISKMSFIKLAKQYPLHQPDAVSRFLEKDFEMLLAVTEY